MISFPCRCGHKFQVSEEDAGRHVQCPRCGLLNDVPHLSALAGIAEDGTYVMEDAPAAVASSARVAEAQHFFGARRVDDQGNEIDLRTDPMELELAPETPTPTRNRYDPETGELIRAIDIAPAAPRVQRAQPVAQQQLSYLASHGDVVKRLTPASIFLELLMPTNFVVWGIVFAAQVFWSVLMFFPSGIITAVNRANGSAIPFEPLMFPLVLILLAHYCNVTEDTGPDLHDDLARPLRDLRFYEDLLIPCVRATLAIFISYLPTLVLAFVLPTLPLPFWLAALAFTSTVLAGGLVAPALLLTMAADGTLDNLKPARVAAVITASGRAYTTTVVLWTAGFVLSIATIFGARWWPDPLRTSALGQSLGNPVILYGLMGLGAYLLHAACWTLGLLYRMHHERFAWLHRQHIRAPGRPRRTPGASAARSRSAAQDAAGRITTRR